MNVELTREARNELADAVRHYEEHRQGLGEDLIVAFLDGIRRIVEKPDIAPRLSHRARRARLRRFPYGIVYRVEQNFIRVYAVMHLHREPGYWRDRLQ